MTLIAIIIVNILIINVWLRISQSIFAHQENQKKQYFALIVWWLTWVILFYYPQILAIINKSELLFSQANTTLQSLPLFILYCSAAVVGLMLVIQRWLNRRFIITYILTIILLSIIAIMVPTLWLPSIFLYYIFVAWWEELLKFFSSKSFTWSSLLKNDIILWSILLALGFWFMENIFYTLSYLDEGIQAFSVLITRWATGYLMHWVFTWTIALISWKYTKNKTIERTTILWVLIWIWIHVSYNIILYYKIIRLFMLIILGAYILLSYLMYSSDSVYLREFAE